MKEFFWQKFVLVFLLIKFSSSVYFSQNNYEKTSSSQITLNFWYGKNLNFGLNGSPQRWLDILGNVSSPNGVKNLKYSLYNELWIPIHTDSSLWIGPQLPNEIRRLYRKGDFVANIDRTILSSGKYYAVFEAKDSFNNTLKDTVEFTYNSAKQWPLPYEVRWENLNSKIENGAQVVDGKWGIIGDKLKVLEDGYDRLVALGNYNFSSFIVRTEITVDSIKPKYSFPSYGAAVGIILKWNGHTDNTPSRAGWQPKVDFIPYGAIAWFNWASSTESYYQLLGNYLYEIAKDQTTPKVQTGQTYVFLAKCELKQNDTTYYYFKYWNKNNNEPSNWILQGKHPTIRSPYTGSILLVAHHVKASFGKTSIVPISYQPPQIIKHPENYYAIENGGAAFSVISCGSGPKNFQWFKNNQPIVGANDSILTLTNVSIADNNAQIYCRVENYLGSVNSNISILYVTPLNQRVNFDQKVAYIFSNNNYSIIYDNISQPYNANLFVANSKILNLNNGVRIIANETIESDTAIAKVLREIKNKDEFTIEIWLKNNFSLTTDNDASILNFYSNNGSDIFFKLSLIKQSSFYNYKVLTRSFNGNYVDNILISDSAIASNSIEHLIITKDKNSKLTLYKNGQKVKEILTSGSLSNLDISSILRINSQKNNLNNWKGDLFYLSIYSRALYPQEVIHNKNFSFSNPILQASVKAKCFLEGPFDDSQLIMRSRYIHFNLLPNLNPYFQESIWNHSLNEQVVSFPDSVVDWILVELRSNLNPSSKIA